MQTTNSNSEGRSIQMTNVSAYFTSMHAHFAPVTIIQYKSNIFLNTKYGLLNSWHLLRAAQGR